MLEKELETAAALARSAGRAILPFYGNVVAQLKEGDSPVTAADHAANDLILSGLASSFPGDAVLSEESRDSSARLSAERVWIVDPLDGTKEFLAQNGEFSIMIGLAVGGRAVLGAVYLPDGDVLYAGVPGSGAWVERGDRRAPLRRAPMGGGALRLVGSRSHGDPLLEAMQRALGITDVEPCGSVGVKCARIAEGRRDLYVHPVPYLKEWDTCAPEAVLRAAGGAVTDCLGLPLKYNKANPLQPDGILAGAPGLPAHVGATVAALYAGEDAGGVLA